MSDGITAGFVDFVALWLGFERVRHTSIEPFLVRSWGIDS